MSNLSCIDEPKMDLQPLPTRKYFLRKGIHLLIVKLLDILRPQIYFFLYLNCFTFPALSGRYIWNQFILFNQSSVIYINLLTTYFFLAAIYWPINNILCNFWPFGLGGAVNAAEEQDNLLNTIFNHNTVCRIAPATPGL